MKQRVHTTPITVEFEDIDSYGIVHHTKLIHYLERSRVRLLSSLGCEIHPTGMSIVLFQLEIRFRAPAFLHDQLTVETFVKSLDEWRIFLFSTIKRNATAIARAETGISFMDNTSKAMIPVPSKVQTAIEGYLNETV